MSTPLFDASTLFEAVRVHSALRLVFRDAVDGAQVTDGLVVTARPAGRAWPVLTAFRSHGGSYGFARLPGWLPYDGPLELASPPARVPRMWIEVHDTQGRFLPVGVELDPGVGLGSGSPSVTAPFFLFSRPSRRIEQPLAAVRGQLVDEAGEPRPHALVRLDVDAASSPPSTGHFGLTDERGNFLLAFAWPPFLPLVQGSPPVLHPPTGQAWDVVLTARTGPVAVATTELGVPDLRQILAQAAVDLWRDRSAASVGPDLRDQLVYNRDLVLRTRGEHTIAARL